MVRVDGISPDAANILVRKIERLDQYIKRAAADSNVLKTGYIIFVHVWANGELVYKFSLERMKRCYPHRDYEYVQLKHSLFECISMGMTGERFQLSTMKTNLAFSTLDYMEIEINIEEFVSEYGSAHTREIARIFGINSFATPASLPCRVDMAFYESLYSDLQTIRSIYECGDNVAVLGNDNDGRFPGNDFGGRVRTANTKTWGRPNPIMMNEEQVAQQYGDLNEIKLELSLNDSMISSLMCRQLSAALPTREECRLKRKFSKQGRCNTPKYDKCILGVTGYHGFSTMWHVGYSECRGRIVEQDGTQQRVYKLHFQWRGNGCFPLKLASLSWFMGQLFCDFSPFITLLALKRLRVK
jgi:hypothetical protein